MARVSPDFSRPLLHTFRCTTTFATIKIAKLGESVEFDSATLPDVSNLYAWTYGLNQSVNDAHASVKPDFETEAEWLAAVRAKTDKRVAQIRTGDVPSRASARRSGHGQSPQARHGTGQEPGHR